MSYAEPLGTSGRPDFGPPGYQPAPDAAPEPYVATAWVQPSFPAGAGGLAPVADPEPATYPPMMVPGTYPPMMVPGPYPPEHPNATVVLVLGILGLFLAGILSPIAWGLGSSALKDVATGRYTSTSSLRVGRILGIVGTCLLVVGIVGLIVMFVLLGLGLAAARVFS